jgi:hypothetical protein
VIEGEGLVRTPGSPHLSEIERVVEAKVQERLSELRPAASPERAQKNGPSPILALASMGFAIPLTGTILGLLHGPEALVGLAIEWTAIAIINIAYAGGRSGPRPSASAAVAEARLAAAPPEPPPIAPDVHDRLPLAVTVKVEQIRRKADVLLQHQDRFPPGSRDLYVLRRTRDDYLPTTVDAYLALAGDDRPLTPAGRTPLQALRDQLDLLDTKLDEIAEDLQRQNADRLLANEHFLEEHFDHR